MKKLQLAVCIVLVATIIAGCGSGVAEKADKVFSVDGMSITLTEGFKETAYEGFEVCYDSNEAAVFVIKESFSLLEGAEDYTLEEYGNAVIANNVGVDTEGLQNSDGLYYFSYNAANADTNMEYFYFTTVFKGPDAFWLVQFACDSAKEDEFRSTFIKWANSVEFT